MGLSVSLLLVIILYVGISAIAGLEVSYMAFSKEMGPQAQQMNLDGDVYMSEKMFDNVSGPYTVAIVYIVSKTTLLLAYPRIDNTI